MWSQHELKYLIENYKQQTDAQIASYINKSTSSVKKKRQRMNLEKDPGRPPKFVESESVVAHQSEEISVAADLDSEDKDINEVLGNND